MAQPRLGSVELDVFNAALDKFGDEVEQWTKEFRKTYAIEILSGISELTPYLTGRARANWQADTEVTGKSITGFKYVQTRTNLGRFGPRKAIYHFPNTLKENIQRIRALKGWEPIWIFNNIAYIRNLEDGSSTQAPQGMVEVTLAAVNAKHFGGGDALDMAVSLEDLIREQQDEEDNSDGGRSSRRGRGPNRTRGGEYL